MPNLNQAPELKALGESKRGKYYWKYDADMIQFLMRQCKPNELRLMLYLCGNAPDKGFRPSNQDIMNKTGIGSKQTLSTAKQGLAEKGWISYKYEDNITILYDEIYDAMKKEPEEIEKKKRSSK